MSARGLRRLVSFTLSAALLITLLPGNAYAVAPSGTPTLLSPSDGATVNANPVLSWTAVMGAAKYRVQVSTSPAFATFAYNVDTYNTKATPPTDLPLGDLYWRVAATDGGSGIGTFADAAFTKAWGVAPTPLTPADDPGGSTPIVFPSQPVIFSWAPLAGAKTYTLEIDDADDFIGATSVTTDNTSYTQTEPQTVGQQFYWRLRATSSAAGVFSEWSDPRSYVISWPTVPTLLAPLSTTVQDTNFSWSPVTGASTYQLQVSPNGDWANNVDIDVTVKGTKYAPPTTLDNGSYFWRVRAKDAKSPANNGGWSSEAQFTRGWPDRPTTLAPAWESGDPTPILSSPSLSWTPVPHASYYEIELSSDINFSPGNPDTTSCYTNHTTWTPYAPLLSAGTPGGCPSALGANVTWYWHVRGVDAPGDILGLWSNTGNDDTFRFIYSPSIPTMTAPANGATVSTPVLSWDPVDDIEKYIVTIKKSNQSTTAASVTTYATTWTPADLDPADGPFYWYVQSVDGAGETSLIPAPAAWRSFTLSALTPVDTFELLTPANLASSIRMPSMTWEPYTDGIRTATYYKVRYGTGGIVNVTPLSGSTQLKFPGFTYAALTLAQATYFWYVEAYDGSGLITTSGSSTFTISAADVLGTDDYDAPDRCLPLTVCDAEADTPMLDWTSSPWAGAYEVTIASDADFTTQVRRYKTFHTALTPRESLVDNQAGQAFFWFVRPCVDFALSRCGPGPTDSTANDNASAFQKRSAPVTLISPANGATVANEITFSWQDYLATNGALVPAVTQEAKQYRIQVSTVADFATIFHTNTVDQTSYTAYNTTFPEGPLYWRVSAIDNSGNVLTSSVSRLVNKSSPAPALGAPANGATVTGVPFLSWTPQNYAARYTVEVYENADPDPANANDAANFSLTNRIFNVTTKLAAWAPTDALAAGTYAWRVRRLDTDSRVGPWSVGRIFRLQPAAPSLTLPANGAAFNNDNLLFQWSSVAGAVQYRFEASTSSAFSSIYSSQTTVMTSWAPTTRYADGTYFWRVKVLNADGDVVATSGSRSFSKDATRPTVTSSPANGISIAGPFTVSFSEPVKFVSTTTMTLKVGGTAVAGTVTPSSSTLTTTASFKPSLDLIPGQSYVLTLTSGIRDAGGNTLVFFSKTIRTSLTVENSSSALKESWDRDPSASASGGFYDASATVGSKTSFSFTLGAPSTVAIVGRRASDGGYADVYVDNVKQTLAPLSFYSAAVQWQASMWSKSLAAGKHTVELRVLGTKPAASTGTWVYLDAFKIGAVSYEENSSLVKDYFRRVSHASASAGSYDMTSHPSTADTSPPTYQLVFVGTGVDWYAIKTSHAGKADVYIDNVKKATVDLYSAATVYNTKVYDSGALASGQHTLKIVVTGAKNALSTGTNVSVDRALIQ